MQLEPARSVLSRRGLRIGAIGIALIAAVVVAIGITSRQTANANLKVWTEDQAIPVVAVAIPGTTGATATISLPGRMEAYSQAQIYARVSGYIKDLRADIGAPVKAGQVLAEIDAPDLDQQIMQAEADLANVQANASLAKLTLDRGQTLIEKGAISKMVLDQQAADFASKQAMVKSSQANLDRLRVLEKYKLIVAPFDGIVSTRSTDIGALINAGSGGGPALFMISDTSRLRVYVNVPQSYVPSINMGTQAKVFLPEFPGRSFPATVEASSRAVDVASGTTRMQLVVNNPNGELMTGAFATVSIELARPEVAINIPASALIFDQDGLRVATVDANDRVVIKPITIARDLGEEIEVASGLTSTDRIVLSPPDGIAAGDLVRVAGTDGAQVATGATPADKNN
jgi:RND family efflux transporter MFP subunit